MSIIKNKDVTKFLADMVRNTFVFDVDEENYVVRHANGERVLISENGEQGPILLYQDEIKDTTAFILNPLAEGLGQTPSAFWFYRTQRLALLGSVTSLALNILQKALAEKQNTDKKEAKKHLPMGLINIASPIIDDIDDKLVAEFQQLMAEMDTGDFVTIYFNRRQMRCTLRCALFDDEDLTPSFRSKFPKIRKKSWEVLEKLMLGIFGITHKDEMVKFTRTAKETTCVRLSSFLATLLAVYQEINPLLDLVLPDLTINLSEFAEHLNNLARYAELARFMVQSSRTTEAKPTSTMVPGTQPAAVPTTATSGYQGVIPGAYPVPGMAPAATQQLIPGYNTPAMNPTSLGQPGGGMPAPYGYAPPPPAYGGYGAPMQPSYGPGFAQPPYGGFGSAPQPHFDPNSIPFAPPYQQQNTYFGQAPMGPGLNILPPPGGPGGYDPRFR